jgi:hypothetical protein
MRPPNREDLTLARGKSYSLLLRVQATGVVAVQIFIDNSGELSRQRFFAKWLLRGMRLASYIVGQERRLVNPPSQVVAGVRTVTTTMDGRDVLPRLSRPFAFSAALPDSNQ